MATSGKILEQWLPIAVETLSASTAANFDLYLKSRGGSALLFRSRSVALTDADLARLTDSGVKTLLIDYADRSAYEEHLRARVAEDGELSLAGKYALLTGSARSIFESAWRVGNPKGLVEAACQFGAQLVDALGDDPPILQEMFDLMLHDYYTFTHSANVATYCVRIAEGLGISDRDERVRIAAGGLLHDIGKRLIPRAILNTPDTLSGSERRQVQHHPQLGFEELSGDPVLDLGATDDGLSAPRADRRTRLSGGHCRRRNQSLGQNLHGGRRVRRRDQRPTLSERDSDRGSLRLRRAARSGKNFEPEIVRCLVSMMQPA